MLLVGLTGGIGSGKSTLAAMLAKRGAVIVDADELARRAVERGSPGFDRVVAEFGEEVLTPDSDLDREALARVVFADPDARKRLESIIHPEVARLFLEERGRHEGTDDILVYAVPLLVENGLQGMFDVVVVVAADEATRVARLESRGIAARAARERMAAQLPDDERERAADVVIGNDGSLRDLERQVDRMWEDLLRRAAAAG